MAFVLAAAAAGCVNLDVGTAPPVTWATILAPTLAYPNVSGQGAVVSQANGTSIGIQINGATAGAHHAWGLRLGTCAVPGQQMGDAADYPSLDVSTSGSASAQTLLGSRLDPAGAYLIDVRVSATDTTRVACGNLATQ
jgi:hypothetical protein